MSQRKTDIVRTGVPALVFGMGLGVNGQDLFASILMLGTGFMLGMLFWTEEIWILTRRDKKEAGT